MTYLKLACIAAGVLAIACDRGEDRTYTLYRSSSANDSLRIHVATFDSRNGAIYNRDTCEDTQRLFSEQRVPVPLRYWCEKGSYRE